MFSGRLKSSCDRLSGVFVCIMLMITTVTVVKSCLECGRRGWRQTRFILYDADSKVIVSIRAGWEVLTRQELREARHVRSWQRVVQGIVGDVEIQCELCWDLKWKAR
jgi:hypothetical protein